MSFLILALCTSAAQGQSFYMLEYGYAKLYDDYLSPVMNKGHHLGLAGEWNHAGVGKVPNTAMKFDAEIGSDLCKSQSGRTNTYRLTLDIGWGMHWVHRFPWELDFTLGGRLGATGGVIYRRAGGNNPADALADVSLSATSTLSRGFRIKGVAVTISEQLYVPIASLLFSQQYGESYYEIWMGNHRGLVHVGSFGNRFAIENLVAADIGLGRHTLRVGYRFSYLSQKICGISRRNSNHSLVIGLGI